MRADPVSERGVHLAALVFDSYVGFGLADLLVPFASHWKPMAVAWGVTGLYLLLAVEVSSLARKRLPNRIWRRLHFLAFPLYLVLNRGGRGVLSPLYVVASLHMLTAGTDGTTALALLAVAASGVAIGALLAVRSGKMAGVVAPGPQPSRSNRQKAGALR